MSNKQDKLSVSYPSYDKVRGQLIIRVIFLVIVFVGIFVIFFRTPPSQDKKYVSTGTEGKTMEELEQGLRR